MLGKALPLLLILLLAGCIQEKVFVCPDETEVSNSSDCFQQNQESPPVVDATPVLDEFG